MNTNIEKIIGYILLVPVVLSVLVFIGTAFGSTKSFVFTYLSEAWIGDSDSTSQLPIYFGLMAIAGAYLIKDKK